MSTPVAHRDGIFGELFQCFSELRRRVLGIFVIAK